MDNHPIPQDVTGFQFKLIGAMTVKQFMYLAVPSVIAWVLYSAPLLPWFVKLPLIILIAVVGLTMAFLPIEGRPADVMLKHFLSALFAANQYRYQKTGQKLTFTTLPAQALTPQKVNTTLIQQEQKKTRQLQALLQASQHEDMLDDREAAFMQNVAGLSLPPAAAPTTQPRGGLSFHLPQFSLNSLRASLPHEPPPPQSVLQDKTMRQHPELSQPVLSNFQTVDLGITPHIVTMQPLQSPVSAPTMANPFTPPMQANLPQRQATSDIDKQLENLQAEKQKLEDDDKKRKETVINVAPIPPPPPVAAPVVVPQPVVEPVVVAPKIVEPPPPPPVKQVAKPAPPPVTAQAPHVAKIPRDMAKNMGLPNVPDTPNLITGIIRDPRGNVLQNILVEVKDKDGNPVRAFKTNPLGQFASATPLLNGTYTITFEDARNEHRFDTVEVVAKGAILLPISVISHDAREELRKALFS